LKRFRGKKELIRDVKQHLQYLLERSSAEIDTDAAASPV
jgi:hypothetical protein